MSEKPMPKLEETKSEEGGLNVRQMKFIDNLFAGMTQKQAYKEAGYEDHDSAASRMLRNVKVQEEIRERVKEIKLSNIIRLTRISETAIAGLLNIIQKGTPEDKVRLDAIKDNLDRVGLKPVEETRFSGEVRRVLSMTELKKSMGEATDAD